MKEKIITAAEKIMRTKGLARTTTKEIAYEAGCSEGSIYNHFKNKEDLYIHVMLKQLPDFGDALIKLQNAAGTGSIRDHLTQIAHAAVLFFNQSISIQASIFSEPGLIARKRKQFREKNLGPHRPNEVVAAYIRTEQQLGRIKSDIDPKSASYLLLGACFQYVFHQQFHRDEMSNASIQAFVHALIQSFMTGLEPSK